MLAAITSFLKAVAAALGFAEKRQELNNSPEMQANARAKVDETIKTETREAIVERDLKKIRELASE